MATRIKRTPKPPKPKVSLKTRAVRAAKRTLKRKK